MTFLALPLAHAVVSHGGFAQTDPAFLCSSSGCLPYRHICLDDFGRFLSEGSRNCDTRGIWSMVVENQGKRFDAWADGSVLANYLYRILAPDLSFWTYFEPASAPHDPWQQLIYAVEPANFASLKNDIKDRKGVFLFRYWTGHLVGTTILLSVYRNLETGSMATRTSVLIALFAYALSWARRFGPGKRYRSRYPPGRHWSNELRKLSQCHVGVGSCVLHGGLYCPLRLQWEIGRARCRGGRSSCRIGWGTTTYSTLLRFPCHSSWLTRTGIWK